MPGLKLIDVSKKGHYGLAISALENGMIYPASKLLRPLRTVWLWFDIKENETSKLLLKLI